LPRSALLPALTAAVLALGVCAALVLRVSIETGAVWPLVQATRLG